MHNELWAQPEIIQAEIVDMASDGLGEWREVRPVHPHRRRLLPALLFTATCLSTILAGRIMFGTVDGSVFAALMALVAGLSYAVPVMTLLLCHEMGHFLQARRYGVYASLPYFLPVPVSPIGTFGAVIAMEPRVGGRRALFDIGISGPLAGLVPTLIFLVVGLHYSRYEVPTGHNFIFGYPPLFQYLATWILGPMPENCEVVFHPMAFAGWVGLLVTSLNLIPIGQLDGGHVLYALLRRKAHKISKMLLAGAFLVVILDWNTLWNWSLMLILLILIGPIHPPTANDEEPLGTWRIILGWLTLAFIIVGFTPVPLRYVPY